QGTNNRARYCLLLALAWLYGCGGVYPLCPYPNAAFVPPLQVAASQDEVWAFRIIEPCEASKEKSPILLEKLEVSEAREIATQWHLRWSQASALVILPLPCAWIITSPYQRVSVCVYRRAYDTVKIQSADLLERWQWESIDLLPAMLTSMVGED